jgi:tetratricopeptide (TPR) repeat protein
VELLLRLSTHYLLKNGETKADLDSASVLNSQARQLSDQAKYKIGKGKSILLEAKIYREEGKNNLSLSKTKEAIAYFEKNNLIEEKGDGYAELSNHYDNSNLEEKIKLKEKALAFYKESDSKKKQADQLKDLGELYGLTENTEKALSILKESLALYKAIKYKELQSIYNLLCQSEIQRSNYKEALKYGLLAEKTALAMNDDTSLQMSSIYSNVGMVYYYLQQNKEAQEYWQKAIGIAKKFNDNGYIRTISANISTMLIRERKFEEALKFIKEYKARYPIADQEFEMRENYILFSTYTIIKQFPNAKIYYEKLRKY